ncbi:MAG: diguanylate cyclase [Rhodospirillaceae bacterium TMED8]|nr:diguanylate cyclase [Magnetovibrio sp.]OUT47733.1 MAG: diguanylate cyclase [Rhodospirillaceae bacterium TMED8]|tara:strand:- start:2471 stop:2893 length:423 start_codon:yes stop_codon:yes gene_type:complete
MDAKRITAGNVTQLKMADAGRSLRHVFIRDFVVDCLIGIHEHERNGLQRVQINLDLAVSEDENPVNDDIRNVICYENLADGIMAIIDGGHVNLVETLAEAIACMALEDPRVYSARVRIEKLDIIEKAASVGVEIERYNQV